MLTASVQLFWPFASRSRVFCCYRPWRSLRRPIRCPRGTTVRQAAILDFVKTTTDTASPKFVPPEERIATFDQDGTTWVEHPMYTQVMYCLERVPAVVKAKPELKNVEPFKTVLSGDRAAIAKLPMTDL